MAVRKIQNHYEVNNLEIYLCTIFDHIFQKLIKIIAQLTINTNVINNWFSAILITFCLKTFTLTKSGYKKLCKDSTV